ncbi:MAG TPA: LysE family translocator [Solirubrobacteraceae bacterium]|nr:LysE family translocator [Solirubrobacteraceae bacterium]
MLPSTAHLAAFLVTTYVLILIPGPSVVFVVSRGVALGRRAATLTVLGNETGFAVLLVLVAVGLGAVLARSDAVFTVLKLIGAAYLVWLGLQALRTAGRGSHSDLMPARRTALGGRGGFRQGLISDLANPKIGAFFTGLLPQFAGPGHSVLIPFLVLGALFVLMTVVWLCGYALVAVKASAVLRRRRVKAAIDRVSGVILIGFGVRLALERR